MLKFMRIRLFGCVKDLDERCKIAFKDSKSIEENEDLKKIEHHWQSFAESEENERKKYLRNLEIQFSMNEFVEGESSDTAKGKMASVVADRKALQQKSDRKKQK